MEVVLISTVNKKLTFEIIVLVYQSRDYCEIKILQGTSSPV